MLLISLPVSARLIPLGESVFPELPANPFIGLAPLAGRGVVVTWLEADQKVIRARELEADLRERRDFDVVDSRGGAPVTLFCPQVARIGQGRLAFAWGVVDLNNLRSRVAYRVMNEDGSPRSPIRYAQGDPPRLEESCPSLSGSDTGFVIGWNLSLSPVGPPYRLRARTFSVDGTPISPSIDLATSESITFPPNVVIDREGGFVAGWTLMTHSGEGNELVLGRYARDGKPMGRPVLVATDVRELSALTAGPQSGFEGVWALREADLHRTLKAQRFDQNLREISPVRTVYAARGQVAIPTAAVDQKARTALVVFDGGMVNGVELDRSLARCGAVIRVSAELPQGYFPVVISSPGEVVVAGVETAPEPYRPKVIVRRYRLGACSPTP
ncbi:MAG: hypothetical protein ABJC13_19655 [Acidobacteriota bacterium]